MSLVLVVGMTPLPAFAGETDEALEAANTPLTADSQVNSPIKLDLSEIQFVYIEFETLAAHAGQNIAVGFEDDELVVEFAELAIIGPDDEAIALELTDAAEGIALFAADDGFASGVYRISSLKYRVSGDDAATYTVSFEDDDAVSYEFQVVEPASESGVTTEVFTIDEAGEYIQADDIASAMAAAGVDPESGPSGEGDSSDGLSAQAYDGFVIVLDAGHGGHDGGASKKEINLVEKEVNLKIAKYCKAKLEETPGVTVYMTRSTDVYLTLSERTQFAIDHNADLVVCLHNNAGGGSGSEVIVPRSGSWYREETYVTGSELGKVILSKLNALGLGTHGGVYSRDSSNGSKYPDGSLSDYYAMVNGPRQAGILGIIVEHAFVDNASDGAFLSDEANLKKLGEADAQAIIEYYDSSKGIDRLYWPVFDADYYLSKYADVKASYDSKLKALGHFKAYGMAEGRRGNDLLDVTYYKASYADLQKAFGDDWTKYYAHFMEYGMKEGRQGSAEFDPKYYKAANADLQNAFGNDWTKYYKHYVDFGKKEGRAATGDTSALFADSEPTAMFRMYNPNSGEHFYTSSENERNKVASAGWRYEGVSWSAPSKSASPVFRLYNPNAGDHHYTQSANERDQLVSAGWNYEGIAWRSDDAGTTPLYRLYNPNARSGAHHYTASTKEKDKLVSLGWRYEGISWYGLTPGSAVDPSDELIMGASQTSVDQMVRRYNAVGKKYPSGVYSKYGAPTIKDFCQILYEEATAEGVRPEVVFAQAMHETGWLQYGGDVKPEQCNFAGIGATGGGEPGNSFNMYGANSVRMGLRAQVQHLKAYASTESLKNERIDPRFTYVTRGSAITVRALAGKWATDSSYGDALISHIRALLKA